MKSGNFFSAATDALIRNASIVTLIPDFSFSLLARTRNASSSVMSASSWLVTCGIVTQLRCSAGPLILLMRDRSLRSIGPNFAKSTCGHGSTPASAPPVAGAPAGDFAACAFVCAVPARTALTNSCTSSCVILPFGPLPFTSSSGTPSSRASFLIVGDACGSAPAGAVGSCGGNAAVGRCRSWGAAIGAAGAGAAAAAARRR